jgi:hypothetical protein
MILIRYTHSFHTLVTHMLHTRYTTATRLLCSCNYCSSSFSLLLAVGGTAETRPLPRAPAAGAPVLREACGRPSSPGTSSVYGLFSRTGSTGTGRSSAAGGVPDPARTNDIWRRSCFTIFVACVLDTRRNKLDIIRSSARTTIAPT